MTGAHLISLILEDDDEPIDAKKFLISRQHDWEMFPVHVAISKIPGAVRRKGRGYSDQWEIRYKDWLFVVSAYEDGTQIWSAYYKGRLYGFDNETKKERKQGFTWSGGSEPRKLPLNSDPTEYLARLKQMADMYSSADIYRSRTIPSMPKPEKQDWDNY